jgi:hemolysin activation/secretion protein
VIVDGATVYSPTELQKLYQSYLGQEITLAQLQGIADSITQKYRNDGYVLSKAILPPQHIKQGVVHIQVVEGFVDQVKIEGDAQGRQNLLLAYGRKIAAIHPLRMQALERYALLANDLPGYNVRLVLAPSKTVSGASDLTFVVDQKRVGGYVVYDNRGSYPIGPHEYQASGNIYGLLGRGDSTGVRGVITTDNNEMKYYEIRHSQQLNTEGTELSVSANYTETNPGSYLSIFDIVGRNENVLVNVNHPLIRSRSSNLYVHAGLDYLNAKSDLLGAHMYNDHIRSLRLGSNYNKADAQGMNSLGLEVSQGLSLMGASETHADQLSRPQGRPDYTKVNFDASRLQSLFGQFSLLAGVTGQYGFNPLLSAEQFGFGGSQFGRAYDSFTISGDSGISAKLELRYDSLLNRPFLRNMQYFTFYDAGRIWNRDHFTQDPKDSATSAGIGTRMAFNNALSGSLEFDQPLTRKTNIPNVPRGYSNQKAPRVFFSLTLQGDK